MSYDENDYLMISGIQHYVFCPRQWALIHIEEQWSENYLTTAGKILHTKAHDGDLIEKRGDLIIFRSLKVRSAKLGITGECDIVEFHKSKNGISIQGYDGTWTPFPVEYKRGKVKADDCDRLQLSAQAVCLEEMLCTKIPSGAIFYGEPRRREVVEFSAELRNTLTDTVKSMHDLYERKTTPKASKGKHCQSCSIKDLCVPSLGEKDKTSVIKYMEAHIL